MTTHRTTIETDFEPRIVIDEQPGRWFKVWESAVDSGLLARMSGGEVRLFFVLARHRREPDDLSIVSEAALCRLMGRSLSQLRAVRMALCQRDAGKVCRYHGGEVYQLMPSQPLLGRRQPTGPPENHLHERKTSTGNGKPAAVSEAPRAQNQPTKTEEREIGQNQTYTARESAEILLDRLGVVGWPELTMFGSQAAERGDLAGVLRDLGAGDGLVEQVEGLAGLTVAEILRTAAGVAADAKAINRPYCLCARLAMAREIKLERPEIGRARRMGDDWAALARTRISNRAAAR